MSDTNKTVSSGEPSSEEMAMLMATTINLLAALAERLTGDTPEYADPLGSRIRFRPCTGVAHVEWKRANNQPGQTSTKVSQPTSLSPLRPCDVVTVEGDQLKMLKRVHRVLPEEGVAECYPYMRDSSKLTRYPLEKLTRWTWSDHAGVEKPS